MTTTTLEYPVEALYTAAVALLEENAVGATAGVSSRLGQRFIAELGAAPRYVWVPTRSTAGEGISTHEADRYRAIAATREHVAIYCIGATYGQAWALRNNLLVAFQEIAGIDVKVEAGNWMRAGAAYNQAGECYLLEVSVIDFVEDAYAAIPSLELPGPEFFQPVDNEGHISTVSVLEAIEEEPQIVTSTD